MAVGEKQVAGGDKKFFLVNKSAGINTESPRQSIKDHEFGWLENLQPIDEGNWRALYSNNPSAIFTTTPPRTIIYIYPFNIGQSSQCVVILDDGSGTVVNLDTGVNAGFTVPGTFYPGSSSLGNPLPQAVQFGQSGVIIVSTATIGFSYFDGSHFFYPGTIGPIIMVTNGGSSYQMAPAVVFYGGNGSGASAVATINNGSVTGITVTNPGSGYQLGDVVNITLSGGNSGGTGASLTAVLTHSVGGTSGVLTPAFGAPVSFGSYNNYTLSSITVTNGGSGYSSLTTAAIVNPPRRDGFIDNSWGTGGGGSGSGPSITITVVAGVITAASFIPPPTVWTTLASSPQFPTIAINDPGFYYVSSVTGTPTGTGYSPSTTIVASAGGSPVVQASIKPIISGGVITGTTILNGGVYGSNTPPTLSIHDSPVTATATAELMPFGVSGTCVEIYQNRIWVGNGPVIQFSAPGGDVANWSVANGAGAFTTSDSVLRREFTALRQCNGFLYCFGDSSIDSINNVQTGGSPVVTTFTFQNVDPQIGTPWHNCVQTLGSSTLMFANTQGVFKCTGSEAVKVSDALDGVFAAARATLLSDTPILAPTAALMQINQKTVYMLVLPVQGPLDMSPRTALVMCDKEVISGRPARWWIGSQITTFIQVATQEVNSVMQAWGNGTTTLNKLFTTPSGSLTKTWQTKLWGGEAGPYITKQGMRLYTMAIDNSSGGYTFTGTYDFMLENAALVTQAFTITQKNLTGTGSTAANVRGNYLGMTLHTTKDDFTLIGHGLLYQEQSPLGG
jgi:hypothetical protein